MNNSFLTYAMNNSFLTYAMNNSFPKRISNILTVIIINIACHKDVYVSILKENAECVKCTCWIVIAHQKCSASESCVKIRAKLRETTHSRRRLPNHLREVSYIREVR